MSGDQFHLQDELRHQGRVKALQVLLSCVERGGAAAPRRAAEDALRKIEGLIGLLLPSAECPEAVIEGMQNIAQALRAAMDNPSR